MPVESLVEFCTLTRPTLVLLSCSNELEDSEAKSLADKYARTLLPICPVWAGGSAMDLFRQILSQKWN